LKKQLLAYVKSLIILYKNLRFLDSQKKKSNKKQKNKKTKNKNKTKKPQIWKQVCVVTQSNGPKFTLSLSMGTSIPLL
jgi:hypothetical protein